MEHSSVMSPSCVVLKLQKNEWQENVGCWKSKTLWRKRYVFFSAFLLATIEKHRNYLCYGELRTSKQGMRGIMFVLSHSKCNTSKAMAGSVVKV
jgi:hypothetical protein